MRDRQCALNHDAIESAPIVSSVIIAKFHYTGPTGPARTQRSFAAKKSVRVRVGPVGSGRARVGPV